MTIYIEQDVHITDLLDFKAKMVGKQVRSLKDDSYNRNILFVNFYGCNGDLLSTIEKHTTTNHHREAHDDYSPLQKE